MTPDQFNTPPAVTKKMIASVRGHRPSVIADFAAGSGELLHAAAAQWNGATMIGMDIDERIVRALRRKEPDWIISRGDFLNPNPNLRAEALRRASGGVDLILLNPPFSSRGGTRSKLMLGNESLSCSRAGRLRHFSAKVSQSKGRADSRFASWLPGKPERPRLLEFRSNRL